MPIIGSIIKRAIELRSKLSFEGIRPLNAAKEQKKVLKKILQRAQYTAIGEDYKFSDLHKLRDVVDAYRSIMPTHDYNSMFANYWYRCLNGEPHVVWPEKIKYFALSSGTSESSSKYIPVTADMLRAIKKTSIRQIYSLADYNFPREFYEKGILMLGGSTHLQFNGTYYEGDLSGITTGNIPFWFQHHYKPGKRISKERNWENKLEEIIKKAPEWDIGVIVGVPAWLQILLERIIERYKLNTIHDLWPNLSIFCHGGVSFEPYAKGFEKLLSKPLTYIETYLASEGFIAYQSRPKTKGMQLVLDNGLFFEFVPFGDRNFDNEGNLMPNAQSLTIDEVEEGKEYALLLTSCSGAYRYLIGDVIRFVDLKNFELVITGRTKHFINLCGEHLSQENMTRAVKMLENEFNIEIPEFAMAGVKYQSMFAHKWYLGTDAAVDPGLAAEKIDEFLKLLNDDYRVERIAAIRNVSVELLPVRMFYDFLKHIGKEGAQNKFPKVLKNERHQQWERFISSTKIIN